MTKLSDEQLSLLKMRDFLLEQLKKSPEKKKKWPPCCIGMAEMGYCSCRADQEKTLEKIIRIEKSLGITW